MKKIFAIALALVMVLSMASAFAVSECATWGTDWSCTTDDTWCGQGKVEVVPYVKVNTACGWEYQVSDCATAIKTEEVFFAIKLTVDAYPDMAWWNSAVLNLETEGLNLAGTGAWSYDDSLEMYDFGALINHNGTELVRADFGGIDADADEQQVYYLTNNAKVSTTNNEWVEAEDAEFDATSTVVFEAEVLDYDVCDPNAVNVCATLHSEYDGLEADTIQPYNQAGDYFFRFDNETFTNGEMTGEFVVYTMRKGVVDEQVVFEVEDGVVLADGRTDNAFYLEVLSAFGLANCGTSACITADNIQKNFGWDDEQEDCFPWSDKGASVVDTDCVVAIPKTGDMSVLAWLF